MNPYAAALGDRDAIEVLRASAAQLRGYLNRLGPRAEAPRAPGKWSPREIACHLADCEIMWAFRLRQVLGEPHHTVQPFDQDRWAVRYAAYTAEQALALFAALRDWNLALIASLGPADHSKQAWHPERGVITAGEIIATMAGHDRHHLAQFEALA